jgi:hypothetical protein
MRLDEPAVGGPRPPLSKETQSDQRFTALTGTDAVKSLIGRCTCINQDEDTWRWAERDITLLKMGVQIGPASGASQPHELEALGARVGHSQVAHEGDESPLSMMRATRTDGGGLGVERRDAQGPARRGAGNHCGTGFETRNGRLTVLAGTQAEEAVEQIRASIHFRRGW